MSDKTQLFLAIQNGKVLDSGNDKRAIEDAAAMNPAIQAGTIYVVSLHLDPPPRGSQLPGAATVRYLSGFYPDGTIAGLGNPKAE